MVSSDGGKFVEREMDYASPFGIQNYTGRPCLITKGDVLVFVYFYTMAILLEPASYLTTEQFLAALVSKFSPTMGRPPSVLPPFFPETLCKP